jgi:hypothetical protein
MNFHPWAILIALPSIIAVFYLGWKVKRDDAKKRDPFTEPLLRPPGESCRQKLNVLYEDLQFRILWVVVPVFFATAVLYAPVSNGVYVVFTAISAGLTYVALNRLLTLRKDILNYQLGFDGERAVGQVINQALSLGCKVYHDVQFDGYNIDHVIVAPSGVYAVETKTRRKGHEKGSHKVRYDGQKLIFPEWEDDYGLEQAQRNAKSLSVWLTKAVGEPIWVEPILTLPGWLVDRQAKGNVNVLNEKEIIRFISRDSQTVLSPKLIQQISYQIEQKNRIT